MSRRLEIIYNSERTPGTTAEGTNWFIIKTMELGYMGYMQVYIIGFIDV